MKRFPTERLRPKGGEIHAVLFENEPAGVPLELFWSFRIDFEPLHHDGHDFECGLMADWVQLPIRDWRDLEGTKIQDEEGKLAASFYTVEHDAAVSTSVSVLQRQGAIFLVDWKSTIGYLGWTREEKDPRLPVKARAWLPFGGVIVANHLIRDEPDWERHAASLLAPFVDLDHFGPFQKSVNEFNVVWHRLLPF